MLILLVDCTRRFCLCILFRYPVNLAELVYCKSASIGQRASSVGRVAKSGFDPPKRLRFGWARRVTGLESFSSASFDS